MCVCVRARVHVRACMCLCEDRNYEIMNEQPFLHRTWETLQCDSNLRRTGVLAARPLVRMTLADLCWSSTPLLCLCVDQLCVVSVSPSCSLCARKEEGRLSLPETLGLYFTTRPFPEDFCGLIK